jgi:hypothetical protein
MEIFLRKNEMNPLDHSFPSIKLTSGTNKDSEHWSALSTSGNFIHRLELPVAFTKAGARVITRQCVAARNETIRAVRVLSRQSENLSPP